MCTRRIDERERKYMVINETEKNYEKIENYNNKESENIKHC